MTLTFDLGMVDVEPDSIDGPDQVVDTLGLHKRRWLVQGREWMVYNGDHCVGVRVPIFPIVVCVRSTYVIGTGVGFRVESGAVALLQLDL